MAHLQLEFARDLKLGRVVYEISGNEIVPIAGLMSESARDGLAAVVSVPSGRGYTLRVSTVLGADVAGAKLVLCRGSTMFDVEAGGISEILVPLECGDADLLDGDREPTDDPTSSPSGLTGPDAGAKPIALDAGVHKTTDASTHDAGRSPGDSGLLPPSVASNPRHDAGASIAKPPSTVVPSAAAGAPTQPSTQSCDMCRLQVCTALGSNSQRIAACFVTSSEQWPELPAPKPGLACASPAQCVQLVCADACPPTP